MKTIILRTITAVLTCCLFCFCAAAAEEASAPVTDNTDNVMYEKNLCDADADGSVTSYDARLVLRCAVGLDTADEHVKRYGDADANETLDSEDARIVLRVSVGLDSVRCILYGHTLAPFIKEEDCTNDGYTEDRCVNCCHSEGERRDTVPAKGHTLAVKETAADCTNDGLYISFCTECGDITEKRVIAAKTGHSFGTWAVKGQTKERSCRNCSFTDVSDKAKTVYLTFDDGPGPYTEKLLGYLSRYGVKATFFVTNQMPRYQFLLPRIVEDGHTIGVHTYTHQWSIYSGRQSYINDFDAMHKLICDKTGVYTKIFRFPGGTNNTVSRSYSRGVMTDVSGYMKSRGFVYYDWNVDCGDTLGYSSSKIASYTIAQIKNRDFSIVLMHDIKNTTVEAVGTIIEYCLANGYDILPIDESTPVIQFRPVN